MTAILSVTTAVAIALGLWLIWRRRSRLRLSRVSPQPGTTPLDDNVRFTVYRPSEIEPQRWYSLLAFVHLSERPADRPDEPDPVAVVKRQAATLLQDEPAEYQSLVSDSLRAIPRAGELTLVPQMDGIEFNPAQQTFRWERSVHRADFQLRGLAGSVPRTARGHLTIYWGPLIVGDVPLAISVVTHAVSSDAPARADTVRAYRQIFASYSHRDVAVVEQFEETLAALGDRYLRDVRDLRAGQVWSDELERMIEQADVFQLFWSWNALASPFVRQEWEFALGLRRENFLRPVYWEDPLPSRGDLPSEGLRRLHFHRLGVLGTSVTPPSAEVRPAPRFRWKAPLAAAAALLLVVAVLPLVLMQNASAPSPAGAPVGSAPPQTTIQPPAAMPNTRPPVDSLPAPVKPVPNRAREDPAQRQGSRRQRVAARHV